MNLRQPLTVELFIHNFHLPIPLTLDNLVNKNIIKASPQSIQQVTEKEYQKIKNWERSKAVYHELMCLQVNIHVSKGLWRSEIRNHVLWIHGCLERVKILYFYGKPFFLILEICKECIFIDA